MATTNQGITLKGNKVTIAGVPPKIGASAPEFKLTGNDLADVQLRDFKNKVLVLCAIPSVDTPVCAEETKRFNSEIGKLGGDAAVLAVSMDLPFAQKRWCAAEGIQNVKTASDYKYRSFGESYGTYMQENGLLCRAVFVLDAQRKVQYIEYVKEVAEQPDFDAILSKVKTLL